MAEETLSFFEKIREIPFIKAYREKHQADLKEYRERKFNKPAVLDKEYTKKLGTIPGSTLKKVNRLLQIFNKDTRIVQQYIDSVIQGEPIDISKYVKSLAHPDDRGKWNDFQYLGEGRYDMLYRSDTVEGKDARRKVFEHPIGQLHVGPTVGLYHAYKGTAELGALIGDKTGITDDSLAKLDKILPNIDLDDFYREGKGSLARFTSVLVQYGLGFSVARKLATRILNNLAKKKIVGKTVTALRGQKLYGLKIGSHVADIAKYGGYWALPAALGDTVVSTQANHTMGDIFGKPDGNWLQKKLMATQKESLEGLTGKERAAAVLRNKLKFGVEGAAIVGGLTLTGKALKTAAWGAGHGLKWGVEPVYTTATRLLTFDPAKQLRVANPWSRLKGTTTGFGKDAPETVSIMGKELKLPLMDWQKRLAKRTSLKGKTGASFYKALVSNTAKDITSIPGWARVINQGRKAGLTKLGVPKYEFWKFSQAGFGEGRSFFLRPLEMAWSRFRSNFKYDEFTGGSLRNIKDQIRKISTTANIYMNRLDRAMYKLITKGAESNWMNTATQTRALSRWADVLKFMRGEIKITELPKTLQYDSRAIRKLIDDQSELLRPILKDKTSGLSKDILENMGKYLHTSYEIFRNNRYVPRREDYKNAIQFYMRRLKELYPDRSAKQLLSDARQEVNQLLMIGRTEGSSAAQRLKAMASEGVLPANIFKDVKSVPDEVARLLGRVEDPKSIILNTLMEQAHTLHSYNAFKDISRLGLNKWLFADKDAYRTWLVKNGIQSGRGVVPVRLKTNYNVDMEGIFKNADGSEMLALPEMAKAITDTTVLMDIFLKVPFFKSMLAVKTAVQMNKTVLSVMTQMRNIVTAAAFAMSNGHMGVGASVADNFEMMLKEMLGKTRNPEEYRKIIEEALNAGALDNSTIARELEQLIPEIMGGSHRFRDVGKMVTRSPLQGKGFDITARTSDEIFAWMFTNKGAMGKVVQKSIEAYQLGDNVWKLFGYQFTKNQLKPALRNLDDIKKYFKEVEGREWNPYKAGSSTPGTAGRNLKTLDEGIQEIAGIQIRGMYPNYSMVPRIVENVRKIPIMGNFVGFTSEMWRNSYQIFKRGLAEMQSSNPYIRQMGARRLLGFSTMSLTLGPVLLDTALYMTGMPKEMIDKWKERFAPEFMKYHTIIPTKWDKAKKVFWGYDFDTLYPYADVQTPFKVFSGVLKEGPTTDENTYDVWQKAFWKTLEHSLKPFYGNSIAFQTLWDLKKNDRGQSINEYGSVIVDWNNDPNPWLTAMTYVYDKALPTTFQNVEAIVDAFNGTVSKQSVEKDPMFEVTKALSGVSIIKIDPMANYRFRIGKRSREIAQAESRFKNALVNARLLKDDLSLLEAGYPAEHIPEFYDRRQANNYRVWSEAYKDLEVMRTLGYTELEIERSLTGRGGWSATDVSMLMKGVYWPTNIPDVYSLKNTALISNIKEMNRKNNTAFLASDFINTKQLQFINKEWKQIPLGLNEFLRTQNFDIPIDLRKLNAQKKQAENIERKQKQILENQKLQQDRIRMRQEYLKKKQEPVKEKYDLNQSNRTEDTTEVSSEVIASKPNQNVVGSTGLTATETAFLSNEEKAMRLKQKGLA